MRNMTRKDLRDFAATRGKKIIQAGYCELQFSVKYGYEIGSNYGLYGWNWTAYEFENCIVCTGYRNMIGKQIDHTLAREAEKFIDYFIKSDDFLSMPFESSKKMILEELKSFIKEA